MLRYLTGKLPSLLLVLLLGSMVAFGLPRLAPGDVAVSLAGPDPTEAQIQAIREHLGLSKPLVTQYWDWISGLFRGDLGTSYKTQRSVASLIGDRAGSTIQLAVAGVIVTIVVGLILGLIGGSHRGRWVSGLLDMTNSMFIAIPSFLVGLALILFFGIYHRWLPVSGDVSILQNPSFGIQYLILPATALALGPAAVVGRLLRTEMLRMRTEEFVDLAVSKGVSEVRITWRHVLRNSLGTAIVGVGLEVGELLAGAVVIEAIFARNGLGQLAVTSVETRDFTVLQVLILLAVVVASLAQILSEILLAVIDPRVRLGGS